MRVERRREWAGRFFPGESWLTFSTRVRVLENTDEFRTLRRQRDSRERLFSHVAVVSTLNRFVSLLARIELNSLNAYPSPERLFLRFNVATSEKDETVP